LSDQDALKHKRDELNKKQKHIEEMIAKNQKLIDTIKGLKTDKITQTYTNNPNLYKDERLKDFKNYGKDGSCKSF